MPYLKNTVLIAFLCLLLAGCNQENANIEFAPTEIAQFVNTNSFVDFAASMRLEKQDFSFSPTTEALVQQGYQVAYDCFFQPTPNLPVPDNQAIQDIIAIPITKDGTFTHLELFQLINRTPQNVGSLSLSHDEFGFVKLFLNHTYIHNYNTPSKIQNVEIIIDVDENDGMRNCETVTAVTTTVNYDVVNFIFIGGEVIPRFEVNSTIGFTREINCTNDSPSVPSNTTVTVGPTNVSNFLTGPAPANTISDEFGWLLCSSWNFSQQGASDDVSTILDDGQITVPVFNPSTQSSELKQVLFHTNIYTPAAGGVVANGDNFRKCMTYAYHFGVSNTVQSLEPVSEVYLVSDQNIASTFGQYFENSISENNCSALGANTTLAEVSGFSGHFIGQTSTAISPAVYDSYGNYAESCGF